MFIECKICLNKSENEDVASFNKRKDNLFNDLLQKYCKYNPKIVVETFLEFSNINKSIVSELLSFLHQNQIKYDLYQTEKLTDKDIYNSRFTEFLIEGDYIDEDDNGSMLNNYHSLICASCNLFDDKVIPNPYFISTKCIKNNQDIYHANNGIFIISERLKNFLQEKIGNEISFGDIKVKNSFLKKTKLKETFYWMRPKYFTGHETESCIKETCDTCNHPIEIRTELTDEVMKNDWGTVTRQKATLDVLNFPENECNIALSGNWYGRRTFEKPMSLIRNVFISGVLFKELQGFNLKGLVSPTKIVKIHQPH